MLPFTPGRENEKIMLAGKALPVWCVKQVHFRAMGKQQVSL